MNINPKQLEKAMKKLGIEEEQIDATEVVIKTSDGDLVISNPSVKKVSMQGQETFQIMGDVSQASNEDDISLVMEQTGKSREEAEMALADSNDIAEAIMKLSE